MIPYFDHFVDTQAKRYHLLLILLLVSGIVLLVPYVFLGVQLMKLNSYDSLFALAKNPMIEWTYLSRILADAISIPTFSFSNLIACLLENISALEVLLVIELILTIGIWEQKRKTMISLFLMVIEILGAIFLALFALKSSSLQNVIVCMEMMGTLVLLVNVILLILFGQALYKQGKNYKKALCYELIEEKEHREE